MAKATLRYSCRQCHAEFTAGSVRDGDWIGRYIRDHAAEPVAESPILHHCSLCRVGIADLVGVQFLREEGGVDAAAG